MKAQFITDTQGKKLSVILPIRDYKKMLDELEDIKTYDKAKARKSEPVPFDQAVKELKRLRKANV